MSEVSSDQVNKQVDEEVPVKVYAYRYVCAVLFFLTALVNCFAPNTFVAVAE
jgi:hypothetical protein